MASEQSMAGTMFCLPSAALLARDSTPPTAETTLLPAILDHTFTAVELKAGGLDI
jgi:hypothetical protein